MMWQVSLQYLVRRVDAGQCHASSRAPCSRDGVSLPCSAFMHEGTIGMRICHDTDSQSIHRFWSQGRYVTSRRCVLPPNLFEPRRRQSVRHQSLRDHASLDKLILLSLA